VPYCLYRQHVSRLLLYRTILTFCEYFANCVRAWSRYWVQMFEGHLLMSRASVRTVLQSCVAVLSCVSHLFLLSGSMPICRAPRLLWCLRWLLSAGTLVCALVQPLAWASRFIVLAFLPSIVVDVIRNSHYWLLHCCRRNSLGRRVLLSLASVLASSGQANSAVTRGRVRLASTRFRLITVVSRLQYWSSIALVVC
jgi:hypothetical protein